MKSIGMVTRSIRLATTAAALAGLAGIASCGGAPAEVDQTEMTTSALTCSPACGAGRICYATNVCAWSASTLSGLQTALQNHPNEIVALTADINASGASWHLGYFAGTLDGMNHTISNLTTSDTIGQAAGLIVYAENATLKNLKLTNLHVSGTYDVGGLVGDCVNCAISNVAVEGALNASAYIGGITGGMYGGTLTTSYFKGTVTGGSMGAGGLVGLAYDDGINFAKITNCYAQAANQTSTLVAGNTTAGIHPAGGIVGGGAGMWVTDVYAIGAVNGRGSSGGLIGQATCDGFNWLLFNAIYRGNVTDSNLGWAGVVGQAFDSSCMSRSALLFFNSDLDKDTNVSNTSPPISQRRSTGAELTWPTAPNPTNGGIFCPPGNPNLPCGDSPMTDPPWDFGTSSQNNVLRNMPGPNAQIR